MKITIFDLEDWERAAFESLGDRHEVTLLCELNILGALDVPTGGYRPQVVKPNH